MSEVEKPICTCDTPTGSESRKCDYCKRKLETRIESKKRERKRAARKKKMTEVEKLIAELRTNIEKSKQSDRPISNTAIYYMDRCERLTRALEIADAALRNISCGGDSADLARAEIRKGLEKP